MRFTLYLLAVLVVSLIGGFWIVVAQVAILNGFDPTAVPAGNLLFIGFFGALLALPFVFIYVGVFAGLFILLRYRAAPGFLAGISAGTIAYVLYFLVSTLILTATGGGNNPIANLLGGIVIILWCGFAAEMVRPILANSASHTRPRPQREQTRPHEAG